MSKLWAWTVAGGLLAVTSPAFAGDFDAQGNYLPDPSAVAFVDFSSDFDPAADRYIPADTPTECLKTAFEQREASDALSGSHLVHVDTTLSAGCAERFVVRGLPAEKRSYRATVWTRHGGVLAQMTVVYPEGSGRDLVVAKMGPTGRTTSDGWVELASNEFSVDGAAAEAVYLRIIDFDSVGSEIDALELVEAGEYADMVDCAGIEDPVCGPEAVCLYGRCRMGREHVPPLPHEEIRDQLVDSIAGQLESFFGGRKTRVSDLPEALAVIDSMREATTAWEFWSRWGAGIRRLHDWHTSTSGGIDVFSRTRRLNACFFAGEADVSAAIEPSHPKYPDVLVSHVGGGATHGLKQGDRLIAVDGKHPIEWALGLRDRDWGWWQACDDRVHTELLERMRGLILQYATTFTYLSCDAEDASCEPTPKTVTVADLPFDSNSQVSCDNRPFYYFTSNNPPASHAVGYQFFRGRVAQTSESEAIYGLLWDTLYGGGDPNGYVNGNLKSAFAKFKEEARGVILDHRAGSGGTLDGAATATQLLRSPGSVLVFRSPIDRAGYDGPATPSEGKLLFSKHRFTSPFAVGSAGWDPDLPVAILIHRDGSASDFFPFGAKGAPNVRIFGPGPTAGAFSTFYTLTPWGPVGYQFASGDSISSEGEPLIGRGVEPDEVVLQKQSDLLAGRDTIVEAALTWLRGRLKS